LHNKKKEKKTVIER